MSSADGNPMRNPVASTMILLALPWLGEVIPVAVGAHLDQRKGRPQVRARRSFFIPTSAAIYPKQSR
jgi:hypothetical protein